MRIEDTVKMLAKVSSAILLPAGNLFLGILAGRQLERNGWPGITTPMAALLGVVIGVIASWKAFGDILGRRPKE